MGREKIEGLPIWLPKQEQDKLEGEVISIDSDAQFGIQITIKQKDGKELTTPAHKWLQNCIRRLKVGDKVEIVYIGEEPPKVKGHSPTQKYEVYRLS